MSDKSSSDKSSSDNSSSDKYSYDISNSGEFILEILCLILCQTEYVSQMCIKLTGNLTTLKNDNCLPTGKTSTSSSHVTKDISPISKRDPIPEKII